jgi:diguanylate cyclase (GGDEF)-like protein
MVGTLRKQSWLYPAIAGLVALVCILFASAAVQTVGTSVVSLAIVPVAFVAWKHRSIAMEALLGLIALSLCSAAAGILRTAADDHADLRIWSEGVTVAATVIVIGGMCFVARNRLGRDFWGILADGGIVALGGWLLSWVTLVRPSLDSFDRDPALTLVLSTFAPLGSIVVFLLVIMLFAGSRRTMSVCYLSGAITLALAAGLLRTLHESGHIDDLSAIGRNLTMLANGFLLAAVLHPSVKTLVDRQESGPRRAIFGRVLLTTTALIVPVVVISATTPKDSNDRLVRMLSVGLLALLVMLRIVQAVRANREAQEELLRSARTDSLTGLPNRGLLLEHINATLRESWKGSEHPTLFFIDLDRFKNINDSLGHSAGDQVLCIVAERLRRAVPERATVARISGDEYVVLDPASPSLEDAMKLANRLLAEFREPLVLPAGDVFVTASIGVARSEPQSHRHADVILRHADTAMYQAKDAGRNRVALFDVSMHERVAHRLTVETALFRALDRRELKLYYQPILEMITGEVIGFEALMRWQQGDGTIVSPAEFIPIAEETGTIIPIGSWALFEALSQLRSWIDDGVCAPAANMSVNVSPRQLADPNFPSIVHEALQVSRISPHLLWLEVTEGIMITEPELALATLRRLRSLGVRVAIDDFGTGYSSLSLLQKFPLQRIKIDRAFVHGVADNNNDRSLVRTIIAMGSTLGLDMVAEGVETVQQLQVLSELGCTKAQGYLISHPVPADAMRTTVAALERMGAWPSVSRGRAAFLVREEELAG